MNATDFLHYCIVISLFLTLTSMALVIYRIYLGPSLPDRILALDLLVVAAVGVIIILAIWSGYHLYVDVAISLGLVGFLATVAFARFVIRRGGGLLSEGSKVEDEVQK
jgi:multicomponent Na+:H+ antiporter subunit F